MEKVNSPNLSLHTEKTTTPMIKQYLAIKDTQPDAILFYRMGDFYEMFFDDAILAAKELEITLTSRDKKAKNPVPMCGVPVKACNAYLTKLISKGYRVAICEQVEDPKETKNIVKREIVRIITPGMVLDETLLDEKTNNYTASIIIEKEMCGLAYVDISTGSFKITEGKIEDILNEYKKIAPNETILPEFLSKEAVFEKIKNIANQRLINIKPNNSFNFKEARENLISHFNTRSLEGFGCENLKFAISAAGGLLTYIYETQFRKIKHINNIETYFLKDYLFIDDTSFQNLEITKNLITKKKEGSLLEAIDKTVTAMGGRELVNWLRYPLLNQEKIEARLDAISEAKDKSYLCERIKSILKESYDIERLVSKISMHRASPRDFIALKQSFSYIPRFFTILSEFKKPFFSLKEEAKIVETVNNLTTLIDNAFIEEPPHSINEGGFIKKGFNEELDEFISISQDGKKFIAGIIQKEKERTNLSTLKIGYNKVFGYYIEVSKSQADRVPDHYIRKQTLVNAERFITDEIKDWETKILNADDIRIKLECDFFFKIRDEVTKYSDAIMKLAKFIGKIDLILNLAYVANEYNYCRPTINEQGVIKIKEARHPVIEQNLSASSYVPNDIEMDNDKNQILIITGPNMAGKSTVLRQTAIIVLMAQIGSFVPSTSANISITDKIFTRIGALDNLSQGQSTFMIEMEETANILNNATPKSLVIMDEIGRGTSTFDGFSIAWAIAEYLHNLKDVGVKTLFATHYHEMTMLTETKSRIKNYNIAVKEIDEKIVFLRKLVEGGTNKSYGIQVGALAGIPAEVIKKAKTILKDIEKRNITIFSENFTKNSVEEEFDFKNAYKSIQSKISEININNMTPIEAMKYLSDLKRDLCT